MEIRTYSTVKEFLHNFEHVLCIEEAANQIFLEVLYDVLLEKTDQNFIFGAVTCNDEAILIFLNDFPYNLQIYGLNNSKAANELLVRYMVHNQVEIKGLNACQEDALLFIEAYQKITQKKFHLQSAMDIMQLEKLPDLSLTKGKLIQATAEHLDKLVGFYKLFAKEALNNDADIEKTRKKLTRKIGQGDCYIFTNENDDFVATAHFDTKLKNGISISGVCTDVKYRGKGYAIALMYYISQIAL